MRFGTFVYFLILLGTIEYLCVLQDTLRFRVTILITLTSKQSLWLDIQLIQISLQFYLALLAVLAILVLLLLSNSIV